MLAPIIALIFAIIFIVLIRKRGVTCKPQRCNCVDTSSYMEQRPMYVPSEAMRETNERISRGRMYNAGPGTTITSVNGNIPVGFLLSSGRQNNVPLSIEQPQRHEMQGIMNEWERIGVVINQSSGITFDSENIMTLFRRPIAPMQELWQYRVQDKNGFVLRVPNVEYIKTGDVITVDGKPGQWKVDMYNVDKWIRY